MTHSKNTGRSFRTNAFRAAFEAMEPRQLMSATSIKANDSGGPDYQYVESAGHVIAIDVQQATLRARFDASDEGKALHKHEADTERALLKVIDVLRGGVKAWRSAMQVNDNNQVMSNHRSNRVVAPLEQHAMIEFVNRTITGLLIVAVGWAIIAVRSAKPHSA